MKTKLIDISKLKPSRIRHEVLPDGFIERIVKFKEVLRDVETTSLEETVSNFQRDAFPETELLFWENVASLYRMKSESNPTLSKEAKLLIFKDIFSNFV